MQSQIAETMTRKEEIAKGIRTDASKWHIRCQKCQGWGGKTYQNKYGNWVWKTCPKCHGKRNQVAWYGDFEDWKPS